jgi:predicted AlkP superfamily phosphohydrolase/phosphomutase
MFDPATYAARQEHTSARPFMADLTARTVVFDLPYCDLEQAPQVRGLTTWGAHDPGIAAISRPEGLHQEMDRLFGPYPATQWIYGFCWPSAEKARAAGEALAQAVEVRSRATRWLLTERLPDWDLAMVVVSEGHSAIEPLWHGVDPNHPLHAIESAVPAASALRKVYGAIDRLIGDLQEAFSDATILLVAMHGMGPNESDVAAMALLPELLYRFAFGAPYMRPVAHSRFTPDGTLLLAENASWEDVMLHAVPEYQRFPRLPDRLVNWIERAGFDVGRLDSSEMAWMPAARYSQFWPRMPAFALPAFYDGRIRINVAGREAKGIVPAAQYARVCEQMIELLDQCRNLPTGGKVVAEIHRPKQDANDVSESEADLYVVWRGAPLGLSNPRLGSIGPLPYRRTGGHTGTLGFLYVVGEGIAPAQGGLVSSFDVVPTIIDLLGETRAPGISGRSLAQGLTALA